MQLNHECIRDLMLYLEANLSYSNAIIINDIKELDYTEEELLYTSERLIEADFLKASIQSFISDELPTIYAHAITYSGHELLDNIRDNSVWNKIKSKISCLASVSISIVNSVAATVISELVLR